jgi:hypothetical protein
LGTYPTLLVVVGVQLVLRTSLRHSILDVASVGLCVPAALDWAFGRFFPGRFSNAWRTSTGILLGAALGRSLYVHFQAPFPLVLLLQILVVTLIVIAVIFVTWLRRQAQ